MCDCKLNVSPKWLSVCKRLVKGSCKLNCLSGFCMGNLSDYDTFCTVLLYVQHKINILKKNHKFISISFLKDKKKNKQKHIRIKQ